MSNFDIVIPLLHLIEFLVLISDIQGLYGLLLTDDQIYKKNLLNLVIYKTLIIIITLKKRHIYKLAIFGQFSL